MAVSAAFLDYVRELFAPWAQVETKRMFGGAGILRDGRMFGLIADDQIYLKVNDASRAAFAAAGSNAFVFASKAGDEITMSYWSMPASALDDADILKLWADRAWAASSKPNPAPKRAKAKALTAKEMADLPLKTGGKGLKPLKKR